MRKWVNKVNLSSFSTQTLFQIPACLISVPKAKHLDVITMFTYSHANMPLSQSEHAYNFSYFINSGEKGIGRPVWLLWASKLWEQDKTRQELYLYHTQKKRHNTGNHGHFLILDSLFLNIPRMNLPKINLNCQAKGENQIQKSSY